MKRLIIIGASGHGKVVADIAKKRGYADIVFLDNNEMLSSCAGYPVIGPDTMTAELDGDVFVAIGSSDVRKKLMERNSGRNFPVLIHSNAVIADDVIIGEGSVVMAGTVINSGARVGKGCIINTSSSVDHDCEMGNYVHVAVGAHLCGTVRIGDCTWIGAGATIRNNVNICGGCTIGAGAAVVNNIDESGTYVGVPARMKDKVNE